MTLAFSPAAERRFAEILSKCPRREAALLPVLWLAQEDFGHLSPEVRSFVAEKMGVTLSRIEAVVSFYTLYLTRKPGRHQIHVCRNVSCTLRGGEALIVSLEKELGIRPGETTADGKFSLDTVECLAACGGAPAVQVDSDYYENATPKDMARLVGKLRGDGGKDR